MFSTGHFSRSERFFIDNKISYAAGDKDEATEIDNDLEIVTPFLDYKLTPKRIIGREEIKVGDSRALRIAINLTSEQCLSQIEDEKSVGMLSSSRY